MPDESFAVRRKIGLQRGYDGRQYTADGLTRWQNPGFRHRQKESRKPKMQATYLPQSTPAATGLRRSLLVIVFRVTRSRCVVVSGHGCVYPNPNSTITFTSFYSPKPR